MCSQDILSILYAVQDGNQNAMIFTGIYVRYIYFLLLASILLHTVVHGLLVVGINSPCKCACTIYKCSCLVQLLLFYVLLGVNRTEILER